MIFGAYGHFHGKLKFIKNGVHICIFYDVFDVGGYAGSSQLEVSLLYLLAYLPCLFFYPTSLSLLNSELICRSYGSFGFLAVVPQAGAVVPLGCYKR